MTSPRNYGRPSLGAPARRESTPRAGASGRRSDRRRDRRRTPRRDLRGTNRARRGPSGDPAPGLLRRDGGRPARRAPPPDPRRRSSPVSFFAYPGKPSDLVPEGCEVTVLAGGGDDVEAALGLSPRRSTPARTWWSAHHTAHPAEGVLGAESIARAIGALLPEGAIVSDEANTSGTFLPGFTAAARATIGSRSPADPSARDCLSPSAPRSPAPTVRCSRSRPTAQPSTRCSPSGRWPGSSSTSPPSSSAIAATRSCGWSSPGSAPRRPGSGRSGCSTSHHRRSTSWRSPGVRRAGIAAGDR